LAVALALSAVTGFLTPVAGAPMSIVRQPGGYSWADHGRFGPPLLAVLLAVVVIIPLVWPL
jgi:di/tricarboxylate transporter